MTPALVALAIQEVPGIIALIRERFRAVNPDAPEPTNEQVIAAFEAAFQSSLAKDDQWLRGY